MSKRNILYLCLTSIVVYVIGFIMNAASSNGSGFGTILIVIGAILAIVAWIIAIIKTASMRRWGWLAAVVILGLLLGGVVGPLIYAIFGPESTTPRVAAY